MFISKKFITYTTFFALMLLVGSPSKAAFDCVTGTTGGCPGTCYFKGGAECRLPSGCFCTNPNGACHSECKSDGTCGNSVWDTNSCDSEGNNACVNDSQCPDPCGGSPTGTPTPTYPANNSITEEATVKLIWNAVTAWGTSGDCTGSYKLYIDGVDGTKSPIPNNQGSADNNPFNDNPIDTGTTANYSLSGTRGVTYKWGVQAINNASPVGKSPATLGSGDIYTYTVNTFPTANISGDAAISDGRACIGSSYTLTGTIADTTNNLDSSNAFYRGPLTIGESCVPRTSGVAWQAFLSHTLTGGSATYTDSLNTTGFTAGRWCTGINAFDSKKNAVADANKGRCSADYGAAPTSWRDCGPNDWFEFTVGSNQSSHIPVLSTPASGSTSVPITPTLTWTHDGNFGNRCEIANNPAVYKYNLQYRLAGGTTWATRQVSYVSGTTSYSYTVPTAEQLLQGRIYEWRVCATNGDPTLDVCSQTVNFWTFSTCTNIQPDPVNLNNPTIDTVSGDNSVMSVTLSWIGPQSWGNVCGVQSNYYSLRVRKDTSSIINVNIPQGTTFYTTHLDRGSNYSWEVYTCNGGAACNVSPTGGFVISNFLQGYVWDIKENSCSDHDSLASSDAISDGNIGSMTPSINNGGNVTTGVWPASGSNYNYYIDNVSNGNSQILCADVPSGKAGFRYRLSCLNDEDVSDLGSGCVSVDVASGVTNPLKYDLGYKLVSEDGWFTVYEGDIYGNGQIDNKIPDTALGGFKSYTAVAQSNVFSGSSIFSTTYDGSDAIAESDTYTQNIDAKSSWLSGFSFTAPAAAEELNSNCDDIFNTGNLDPKKVYVIDSASCMQDAIDNLDSAGYELSDDGVVVIYVNGDPSDSIKFGEDNKPFKSKNTENKKILFVIKDSPVYISKDLGLATIQTDTDALIQAGFIVNSSVIFESNFNPSQPSTADLSVVVDGPVISAGSINMSRNRDINNVYPGEFVKYDLTYLTKLYKQELDSTIPNYTGLSTVSVDWEKEK